MTCKFKDLGQEIGQIICLKTCLGYKKQNLFSFHNKLFLFYPQKPHNRLMWKLKTHCQQHLSIKLKNVE